MEFGIKNKKILKMLIFICAIIVMIGLYSIVFKIYDDFFSYIFSQKCWDDFHNIFFCVYSIAGFVFDIVYVNKKSMAIVFLALLYLFYEWFLVHPFRVVLMGGCFLVGYVFTLITNKHIHKVDNHHSLNKD